MKLLYRPEIDGLRAVAVVSVILYHAQLSIFGYQPLKGGFIGVDIFFVISGYLITSIILKELVTTGSFSFKHFYERRIRRILPALLFVMLVSLPFAWIYLIPTSFIDYSKSILYSLGFTSNFYFWYSGQQYGTESGLLKPFLHTWSLSVEEQYYILIPIFLLITFKYFRKNLIYFLIFGFILSLGIADWGSRNYPSFNFYILPMRGWELLAGSILAYFEINNGYRSKNKTLNLILPTIGLFLIAYSIVFFNDKMFHPSFYTLSPVIGVCLIIWFSYKDEIVTKILSSKLFVGIGLISYSLYLWHYPILAFSRIIDLNLGSDIIHKSMLGLITLILSIFSYYIIELPFRNKKNKFNSIVILISVAICILIIFTSTVHFNKKNFPPILNKNFTKEVNWNLLKNPENQKNCHGMEGCKFNIFSKKKIYAIGDSHIGSLLFNLKDRVVKKKYQFINHTSCFYFPDFNRIDLKTQKGDICFSALKEINQILSKEKNAIIILGGRLPLYLSNSLFDNQEGGIEGEEWSSKYIPVGNYKTINSSLKNEVKKLSKNNQIILIYPIPEVGWHVPRKLLNSLPNKNELIKKYLVPDNYISTSFSIFKNRTKSSFALLDSIKGDNIHRVYPHTLFCDTIVKNRCIAHDNTDLFYADYDHPSLKGAEMINDLIIDEIIKIEFKSD